ncbi:Pumilio-family RNA binding repeat-containing protein [Ascoidea rubescens DSM 1968]|uniref:ARM repeat-containing protein n=1 Tax=Ascoidea rubescens DSM 1968 TaxID=1344418 RepID=A0A1D2VRF6_9ASCO|nr:ARM repeat-containing protein [Ascoidea rubescens DSM 1968]ODV64155.1 ARM repeat-containing protein [Ascoidea rubescens DSM 1968]
MNLPNNISNNNFKTPSINNNQNISSIDINNTYGNFNGNFNNYNGNYIPSHSQPPFNNRNFSNSSTSSPFTPINPNTPNTPGYLISPNVNSTIANINNATLNTAINNNGINNNTTTNNNNNNNSPSIRKFNHNNITNRKRGEDASKFLNAKLEDFKGQIYILCKDQHGCRFLQKQLDLNDETFKSETATMIFEEICDNIVELMTDPFGNYLIQKLLEKIVIKQRVILIKNAASQFTTIALDPHGTRALQKLIEVITTQEENSIIISSFEKNIVSLSRDLNGNHVVQKILTKFNSKPENIQFIFDAACQNCIQISTHRHGCCVLQRCLDYGSQDQCKQLSLVIANNCLTLSLDPFGNYVVQYVLSKGDDESIRIIVDSILGRILRLSTHKFGSNVIEKTLRTENLAPIIIDKILRNGFLTKLLHDAFGNYVLQTSLDVAKKPKQFNKLCDLLRPLLPGVRNTPHGRRISARIQPSI